MINIETNGRVAKGSFSHAFWRLLLLRVKSRATWQIWKRRGHCVEVHGSLSRWPPCSSKTQTVRATPRLSVMLIHMQGWLKCRRWIFACCLYNDTQGWSPTSLPGHLLLGWFLCNFFFFPQPDFKPFIFGSKCYNSYSFQRLSAPSTVWVFSHYNHDLKKYVLIQAIEFGVFCNALNSTWNINRANIQFFF